MRVAFVAPLPFSIAFGGLEIQVLRTAEALRALGVHVDLLDPWKQAFDADLLHCFGSEYQLGEIVDRARDRASRSWCRPCSSAKSRRAYRAWDTSTVWCQSRRRSACGGSAGGGDAVIALQAPRPRRSTDCSGTVRGKIHVIPNGVDDRFCRDRRRFRAARAERFALCGDRRTPQRIAPGSINFTGWACRSVLIGPSTVPDGPYARAVADAVRAERWCGSPLPPSPLLASAYAAASVCVLPSLTEGQPLAALEAAAAGANLVVSDLPYLRDTFGASAWYCDPRSPSSIRRAVFAAGGAPRGARYAERPAWLQPWRDVAVRVQDVYRIVLEGRSVARAQPGLAGPQTQ
jgi:glycosyltransferase involved in cell wall biosynthesis